MGNPKRLGELLLSGADPDLADPSGLTPLMLAASEGEVACVSMLLAAGANPSLRARSGRDAIALAHDASPRDGRGQERAEAIAMIEAAIARRQQAADQEAPRASRAAGPAR